MRTRVKGDQMPFDPLVVFTENDRFAAYRAGREESALSRSKVLPIWSVLRYDECVAVLRDPEHFASDPMTAFELMKKTGGAGPLNAGSADAFANMAPFMQDMMVTKDGATHSRLRSTILKAFTPRMIAGLEPRIGQLADELLGEIESRGDFDMMEDFAIPLPIFVIAEILGVDPSMRAQFKHWSNKMVLDPTGDMLLNPGGRQDLEWAREFTDYFEAQFEERRRKPREDLVSQLVELEKQGEKLNPNELMAMCAILLVAGNETTTNWIGNAMVALTEHPDAMHALAEEPEKIPNAMEEVLRFYSPVQCLFRFSLEGARIGDREIPPGQLVLPWLQSANRDPAVFENPDVFDIDRDPSRHIAFGSGIHFCVGAPLARLEMKAAMPRLLARLPGLHRTSEKAVRFRKSLMLYGPESVPMGFDRRAA